MPSNPAAPTGKCFCDCGGDTAPGSYFLQGHDKRAERALAALLGGSIVDRLVTAGYGPGGKSLRKDGVERGVLEECGIDGCTVYSSPNSPGLRRHRQVAHAG